MNNLNGKTALVTGASRGSGRASALALAQAGAHVLVHYSSSSAPAVAFLASDDARWVTGHTIHVDGGSKL